MSFSSRFFEALPKRDNGMNKQIMSCNDEGETKDQIEESEHLDDVACSLKSDFSNGINDFSKQLDKEVIVIDDNILDDVEKHEALTMISSEESKGNNDESRSNLFSKFAYGSSILSSQSSKKRCVLSNTANLPSKKQKSTQLTSTKQKVTKQSKVAPKPMSELSLDERDRIHQKWHTLIQKNDATESDHSSSLENARFQLLVAARLHARCHEPAVRKCMMALSDAGVLTCPAMAVCDPTVLASLLVHVPHYNTKAQQLVQAAQCLISRFHGQVPESKEDLQIIPGIGPVFADLLSVINTRAAHLNKRKG